MTALDKVTLEAAAQEAERLIVPIHAGSRVEIQDRLERQNKVAREIADAIRALPASGGASGVGGDGRLESLQEAFNDLLAFNVALLDLPEVPSIAALRAITHAAMNIRDIDLMPRARQMQRDLGLDKVPPKTEYECAAALWSILRAALLALKGQPAPGASAVDETAWLIELKGDVPTYWMCEDWTRDIERAIRFARKQDAQRIIDDFGWTEAEAVEHMWCEPRAKQSPAPGAGENVITLSKSDYDAFLAALDRGHEANEKLQALLASPAPGAGAAPVQGVVEQARQVADEIGHRPGGPYALIDALAAANLLAPAPVCVPAGDWMKEAARDLFELEKGLHATSWEDAGPYIQSLWLENIKRYAAIIAKRAPSPASDGVREALEPFAALATQYEAAWKDLADRSPAFDGNPHLHVGHFRRARAALQAKDA